MSLVGLLEAVAGVVTHPLATLGGLLGLFVGLMAALALHWLFPHQSLPGAQSLLLGVGFVVGLVLVTLAMNDLFARNEAGA